MDPAELSGTCWRDDWWIQLRGQLRRDTVLDYFANSPFHDNNAPGATQRGPSTSTYTVVDDQAPHLFIIRKVDTATQTPEAYYYVLDNVVYQAPNISSVLLSRLERCVYHMSSSFDLLRADLVGGDETKSEKQQEEEEKGS